MILRLLRFTADLSNEPKGNYCLVYIIYIYNQIKFKMILRSLRFTADLSKEPKRTTQCLFTVDKKISPATIRTRNRPAAGMYLGERPDTSLSVLNC